jgi:phosphomannomutase
VKFGTSGVRGLVADMTDPVCAAWVTAFLRHLRGEGAAADAVLIGRDRRPSSERIAAACSAAVAAEGGVALDAGVLPTPALALAAAARGVPAVMVTGSHIPFDRNGLKFYRPEGEITKADEAGILATLAAPVALPAATARVTDACEAYVARYVDFFGADALRGLKVGVYEHSAAGRDLLGATLARLGAEVVPLGRTETFVPVDTEAIDAGVARQIGDWVRANRLDALVSTDGDGDRPLLADETGTVLRGDALCILAARAVGADAVAAPLNVSTALERSGWFGRTLRTRIGSPYVIAGIEALAAQGARLAVGFEANGGFLLGGSAERDGRPMAPLPTRDAMLPMLAPLAEAVRRRCRLSDLNATLPERATASGRLEQVADAASRPLLAALERSGAARDALARELAGARVVGIDTIDGLRMTFDSGEIVHLRRSGNAPELRCYAEAETPAQAEALAAAALARVRAMLAGHAVPTA